MMKSNPAITCVVYVLDSGIEDENKEKLLFVCKSYNRSEMEFIPGKRSVKGC
jgi:hypothetical protein